MDSKRFFLFLTLISVLGLSSCTGVKKSRCEECPEFTQQMNDSFFNNQNVGEYETNDPYYSNTLVCSRYE